MKLLIVAISAVASLVLFACGNSDPGTPSHGHTHDERPAAHGTHAILTLDELKGVSELLVKGSPTAITDIQKNLTDATDYPEDMKALDAGVVLDIKKVTFRVDEYYKGTGPGEITVMVDATGAAPVTIKEGTVYVLHLFRSDSIEGKAFWDQAYLVQGLEQGVWVVNGDTATRKVGDVKSVPLSRFLEEPAES